VINFYYLIVLILATFGLTFGLVNRDGAFQTMKKIRERIGKRSWSPFHCEYCTGVWVSLIFCVIAFDTTQDIVLHWWAVAGGSWIISALFEWVNLDSAWEEKNK
jgi:hypothetical protein